METPRAGDTFGEWAATQQNVDVDHDWWDPGEKYPRLRVWGDRGVVQCCRRCGVNKREDGLPQSACKGDVKVELR